MDEQPIDIQAELEAHWAMRRGTQFPKWFSDGISLWRVDWVNRQGTDIVTALTCVIDHQSDQLETALTYELYRIRPNVFYHTGLADYPWVNAMLHDSPRAAVEWAIREVKAALDDTNLLIAHERLLAQV